MAGQLHPAQPGWISYAVTIGIMIVVMALRFRRMGTMRPLNLGRLWVVPAIYLAVVALLFVELPPPGAVAIGSAGALCLGAVVGWWRGRMIHIHVDPETHALNQKTSPAAIMLLVFLVVARAGARTIMSQSADISPATLTDPLIAFALGMFTLSRLEIYLRSRRFLDEARAAS